MKPVISATIRAALCIAFLIGSTSCSLIPGMAPSNVLADRVVKRASLLDFLITILTGSGNTAAPDMRDTLPSPNAPAVPQDTLDLYAAYSGAAYNVSTSWDCGTECQHPGTEGTVVMYHWNTPLVTSTGYIAINSNIKTIVVAFRGSNEPGDWVQDFELEPTNWPDNISGSSVVSGFLSGYLITSAQVIQTVVSLSAKFPGYTIVATGHSLGGSRASLFVADLTTKYPDLASRVQLFTYGQAKCGNQAFAQYMDSLDILIFREVNKGDITPHLPFDNRPYVHFGTEAWVTFSDQTVFCKSGEYDHCSASLPPASYNFADHSTYKGL
ncbi:hypothetical protein H4218_001541 [Coemansia sp. IMI 209128]|nr:hypothetical protein GGI10_001812 [Coemansia sp. RSA 2530]KAJ2701248.1 hypothetical protein H4218_001541 [Coemansia sp. IMI 209128]